MKTILKCFTSLFLAAVIVLCVAPCCENGPRGESSLYPRPLSETVRRAILKSIQWANDKEILRLVNRAEKKYGSQINQISNKYYTSAKDIKAIAIVESLVDEAAKSSEGAIGLMGIKRTTGMAMGFTDIEHPIENLNAGTKYYQTLLKKFKDRELALAAYNLGPGKVENRLTSGFDPETLDYIWKIRRVVHMIDKSEPRPGSIKTGKISLTCRIAFLMLKPAEQEYVLARSEDQSSTPRLRKLPSVFPAEHVPAERTEPGGGEAQP